MGKRVPLPLVGGAYEGRALSVNAERCVNFYPEKQGEEWVLVGTPGLTLRLTLGHGPVRDVHYFRALNVMLAVAGNAVYKIESDHTATQIGTIGTSVGPCEIEDNGVTALIVDGSSEGYTWDGTTFAAVADADFLGGVRCGVLDGYFGVNNPGSGQWQISELNSATSWLDTDYAEAEGSPDNLVGLIPDHREWWLGGEVSMEVWVNTGDADFPFERTGGGYIPQGLAAPFSLQRHDNSLNWLAANERGQGLIVSSGGNYKPTVISPIGINYQIAQLSQIHDAIAFSYQLEGHEFYVLTFPGANRTYVFDAVTKHWHQWSSNIDDNPLSRHRANCHTYAFGRHYVGDYASGKVYTIEADVYTEAGSAIIRDRIGQHVNHLQQYLRFSEVQVLFDEGQGLSSGQGSDPQAMLRWSKDGGRTWSNELTRSVGALGDYERRAIWRKLGGAYQWTFHLRVSDPIKWIVRGAVGTLRGLSDATGSS